VAFFFVQKLVNATIIVFYNIIMARRSSDKLRKEISKLIVAQMSERDIAKYLNIDYQIFKERYKDVIESALPKMNILVVDALIKKIKNGDMNAIKLYLTSVMKWDDMKTIRHEIAPRSKKEIEQELIELGIDQNKIIKIK
jgi:hypothetical protein